MSDKLQFVAFSTRASQKLAALRLMFREPSQVSPRRTGNPTRQAEACRTYAEGVHFLLINSVLMSSQVISRSTRSTVR